MNIYYSLYCRAYSWYNTTGKKDKDTLRISAIAIISGLPIFNFLTFLSCLSLLNRHTPLNNWTLVIMFNLIFFGNLILISSKKSDKLLEEFSNLNPIKKRRINAAFYIYLIITISLLIASLGYIAYFKHENGNYDVTI